MNISEEIRSLAEGQSVRLPGADIGSVRNIVSILKRGTYLNFNVHQEEGCVVVTRLKALKSITEELRDIKPGSVQYFEGGRDRYNIFHATKSQLKEEGEWRIKQVIQVERIK